MMFSVTSLAGAFSGLLAFGIQHLDGKHGIAGWQWIFIVVRIRSFVLSYISSRHLGGSRHYYLWSSCLVFRPHLT